MTLLSRRKHRTTVRSITPGTAAAKAALLLALFAAPALAQPPGAQPKAQPGGQAQPNGLALPPGYRPRTPPPQTQPAQPVRPASGAMPGSGGTVMYFQKPADALTATGGGLPADGGVAQLGSRSVVAPLPVPDVAPAPVRPAPLPPAPSYQPPAVTMPLAVPTGYTGQPVLQPGETTSTSDKKKQEFKPEFIDPKKVQLPSRDKIFGMVYNDVELERAIVDSVISDRIAQLERQIAERAAQKPIKPEDEEKNRIANAIDEKNIADLRAIKDPGQAGYVFPPLPVISPPGLTYQPKTLGYGPRTLYMEPGYVVHRRLHFEERNAERQGWDLGPLSTLVSAGHFYRDVLLWPQSLVSGCVSGFWDTSAGKCMPGSPSPYYLYPPGLTLTGTAAEGAIITGAAFLFP